VETTIVLLALAIAVAAALYSSVGHGGASAYIALMALAGFAPEEVRPAALILNVVVAGLGAVRYLRAGRFAWQVFWPFAVTAIPAAFIAGSIDIPASVYRPLLAFALGAAALRYLIWPQIDAIKPALSPLLVFMGWADAQRATGIAALFIVVNSIAGLAGRASSLTAIPAFLPWLALAAIVGAAIGTTVSLKGMTKQAILRALGAVLGIAAAALVS
jgi:uncharacterized membrane protein YfcA